MVKICIYQLLCQTSWTGTVQSTLLYMHSPMLNLRWEQQNEADLTSSGICILKSWQGWCHRLVSHHLTLHRSCAHLDTKEWAAQHRLGGKEWWGCVRCESVHCDVTSNQHNRCLAPLQRFVEEQAFPSVSNLNSILFFLTIPISGIRVKPYADLLMFAAEQIEPL